MHVWNIVSIILLLLVTKTFVTSTANHDDLSGEDETTKRYSSRIRSIDVFGLKTSIKHKHDSEERIETAAAGGNSNSSKSKEDDDEEKTLAQQVADGKYGLIQNEIFPHGSKRPGIISYLPNPEVPKDTKDNLGGLEKDEIWLAEDHVLVLRGGIYNSTVTWPPIDDYVAPTRQVKIPENPSVPPPFPVQLMENGPLEFIKGQNNKTVPFPIPPPFLGGTFVPPPGNLTDFDEDDPSIYYPPKYDFIFDKDNSSSVPPGPLVPGIILPPPPNFFAPAKPDEQENETDFDDKPFVGPAYLPAKKPISYVYPEKTTARYPKKNGFTSPIYVPNSIKLNPTPKPNHISLPADKPLRQDIYIVTTQPPEQDKYSNIFTTINDIPKRSKSTKPVVYESLSPEIHPLRSLIRPNVSVNYIGKVGHLPPSTAFPYTKGHYITLPPDVTVTPVPIVKKIKVKPQEASTKTTIYYYEEPPHTTEPSENEVTPQIKLKYVTAEPNFEIEHGGLSGVQSVIKTTTPRNNILKVTTVKPITTTTTTEKPIIKSTTDGPFIPSNYYATADPSSIHFTPLDHSIVDDMTMKYFTIFGKKINGVGTTPLTPTKKFTTTTPKSVFISQTKPTTHFEQFLKEITGEDQQDYIVNQNLGTIKHKKAKSRPLYNPNIYKQYQQPTGLSQYLEDIYHSTLRPITTPRPQFIPASHNFGQYLQEVTYSNPKLIKPSHLQYFEASSPAPARQVYTPKPINLANDILVNYRRPLPNINPDAEYYYPTPIKVVEPPNLNRKPPQKQFYDNIPRSGYYTQPVPPHTANAFISYNLPGNGGHFYFLTPQAIDRSDDDDNDDNRNRNYVKRSDGTKRAARQWVRSPSTQDFHRHRRKRP